MFALLALLLVTLGAVSVLAAPAPLPVTAPWPVNFTRPNPEVGKRLLAWRTSGGRGNPEEQGTYYQGDIILPERSALTRNGIGYSTYRWPAATIPYTIASTITGTHRNNILAAMSAIQSKTCVRFVARTTEADYVSIERANSGCWSYIGRKGGKQELNLQNPGCTTTGTAIHEMMHAIGFFHEHTRDDRDNHVTIQYQNIQPGQQQNFDIWQYNKLTFGVPYDYASIMHYSANAFSVNGQPTIVPKVAGAPIGQRTAMTDYDIAMIRAMYKCP